MKKILIALLLAALAIYSFFEYRRICASSPECACRNATPGDPTCMSQEQLSMWCAQQNDKTKLPQCGHE